VQPSRHLVRPSTDRFKRLPFAIAHPRPDARSELGEFIWATKSWCNAMISKTTIPPRPDRFETYADARERRTQKIRILSQGDKDQQRLATKLERCRKGCRCESAACNVCLRLYRLRLFRQTGPMLAARPHWTRASVVPAGFLLPLGELVNVELKALGEMIDKRLERSSLRRRIVLAGIDISLNLQDNNIIGWQLHLYTLIEGENKLRLREAIKAAFSPELTAPTPYDFDQVNDPSNCVTYLFKAIFKRRSRYTSANGHRTKSLPLKSRELRELLEFLDHNRVGERLSFRGIRRNGRRLVIISKRQKVPK
jgi:hypothetical protein